MSFNENLIKKFYSSFQDKNFKSMQKCYAENAVFNDSVFQNLNADRVRAMWEMFCLNGKDLRIEFNNVFANENSGKAEWTAYYTFSLTGRKVVNHINAEFIFENGKIIRHTDSFSFYRWAKQSLGLRGFLLGHTSFLKNRIRKAAMKNLDNFMSKKKITE